MWRAFKIKLDWNKLNESDSTVSKWKEVGSAVFEKNQKVVQQGLSKYISPDGTINGSQMQDDWFPQLKADVFLSHSHVDEKTAIILAGFLKQTFGLETFIDSTVWGYSNTLLKAIDKKYCKYEDDGKIFFNYDRRNESTSHVHMMLSSALSKMIYSTECLFFLNTPNSISSASTIAKTFSPWLYYEIGLTHIIEKKNPRKIILEQREYSYTGEDELKKAHLKIEYDLNFEGFHLITNDKLKEWLQQKVKNEHEHALDTLYRISPK